MKQKKRGQRHIQAGRKGFTAIEAANLKYTIATQKIKAERACQSAKIQQKAKK